MCGARLRAPERAPSARFICTAWLREHELRFHKRSTDGSAKADAYFTGTPEDIVHGVLFAVDPAEKPQLDRAEGLGNGYDEGTIKVIGDLGQGYDVLIYRANASHIDPSLLPYAWYKRFVIEGAREHGLPRGNT